MTGPYGDPVRRCVLTTTKIAFPAYFRLRPVAPGTQTDIASSTLRIGRKFVERSHAALYHTKQRGTAALPRSSQTRSATSQFVSSLAAGGSETVGGFAQLGKQ
jgi:hypothetical protein